MRSSFKSDSLANGESDVQFLLGIASTFVEIIYLKIWSSFAHVFCVTSMIEALIKI